MYFKENSLLLQELNSLREELKIVRGKIEDYEIAKKTFDERGGHSIDTLIQTLNADAGYHILIYFYLFNKSPYLLNVRQLRYSSSR